MHRDPEGQSYELKFAEKELTGSQGGLVLGRSSKQSRLVVSHDSISRQHARLFMNGATLLIQDLKSGNGTTVNGQHVSTNPRGTPLKPGDRLSMGEVDFVFDRL